MSVAKHNEPSKSVSQELDVEAAVLTRRIAEKNRQLSVGKKILCGVASLLALSVVTSSGLSVAVADLYTKEVKVEDGSLKSTGGNTVATHNRKNVYAASKDFEKNETESRRRLEAGDTVQVAAVTCAAVREGIGSLEVGDNEGAVKMAMGGGYIFTASVTASFYHTGANFGIEGIHLDGSFDVVYGVECEEAKCSDTAYQCPVLGLAVTDEGRRLLDLSFLSGLTFANIMSSANLGNIFADTHGTETCHPAGSYFTLENGKSIAIEDAAVGTLVKTDTGFQPILGFLHADEDVVGSYLHFTTPSASMTISPLHHAFVNGAEIDPSFIKLGDLLHTPHGLEPVTRIETLEARGAYHPFVKGGNYFVDGILASDYYGLVPKAVWSLGRAYVEARFWLGIPVIPVGKGFFPDHAWAAGSLGRAGVPLWAQKTVLFPLTVASSILTEFTNVAIERFPAWLGTAAAATAAIKAGRKWRGGKA